MGSITAEDSGAPAGWQEGLDEAELLHVAGEILGRLGRRELSSETSDEALTTSLAGLHRLEAMVHGEKLRRVAEAEERRVHLARGARSPADLLVAELGLTRREAKIQADTAAGLARLPETAGRLARGELGVSQAQTAARALADLTADHYDGDLEATPEQAEALAQAAAELDRFVAFHSGDDAGALRRRIDQWQHSRGSGGLAERERRAWRRRRVSLRTDADGVKHIGGRLDTIGGAKLQAALDALSRPAGEDDTRTFVQRQADALVILAERALATRELPKVAAQRPHVLLITTAEALHDVPGAAPAELDGHGPVSSATARQLCCDAESARITVERNGEVLDAGRRRRDPSRAQRDAVIARDRHCVGCGTAASRCEVHHIEWWTDQGPTDLDNLCLLCWNCHHHVHHYDWQVVRQRDGSFTTRRPGLPPDRLRHAA